MKARQDKYDIRNVEYFSFLNKMTNAEQPNLLGVGLHVIWTYQQHHWVEDSRFGTESLVLLLSPPKDVTGLNQWDNSSIHLPFEYRDHALILHIVVCVKVSDAEMGEGFAADFICIQR